ncbi:HypC/HybG/HupF family hydrogenase formation chaperone [Mangrovimicrobium sediminis]|uniref:HypC/HybG/HupF family hydrogenase formation chaperone n=1 Tax=Mangrovimicrobium sediminis TaxID=2562682 RepID=A0A4Z0M4G9_9GAMM|nr:HypC/HybG/HupF family hydrogenase formation chaperone [Haliea sp. SAOS-164]TGD74327.1 HypC/HybG/HupF family hydrogenase formation chaperone [Haliea sp. SAOS-164]
MCIGIPMQVIESAAIQARCRAADGREVDIDMLLVGEQPAGTWLMTFLDTAREVISDQRALEIQQALDGLQAALRGESFDHLFADLVDREPQLPEFLRDPAPATDTPS